MTLYDAAQQLEIECLAKNFDLYDARLNKCPFETLAHMRSQAPVHHTEANGGHWVIVAYAETNEAARDWHRFTSTSGIVIGDVGPRKFAPIEYDPPLHSEFRNLMSPFFTKQAAKAYEQPLSEYADHLIDAFAAKGEADLTESYAKPLAGHIFFTLMFNLPLELAQQCYAATNDAMFSNDKDTRLAGFAKVGEYSLRIIRERKGRPSDGGLIDTIRTGVIDGRPITDEESAGAIQTLFLGGHDTMIHAMGNLSIQLGRNHEIRDRLAADPALLPQVVEESLRHTPPAACIARTVVADMEFGGQRMRAGDKVLLMWLSANRDDAMFQDAEVFDITRTNLKKHIGFGMGPHRCIGEWVARMIISVAIERLLSRLPDFALDLDVKIEYRMGQSRGPVSVPVHFSPR